MIKLDLNQIINSSTPVAINKYRNNKSYRLYKYYKGTEARPLAGDILFGPSYLIISILHQKTQVPTLKQLAKFK